MKNITTLFLALLMTALPVSALADGYGGTEADVKKVEYDLNNSATAGPASSLGSRLIKETVHTLKAVYNFSTVGGAVTTINLRGEAGNAAKLPKNAIIRDCVIDEITNVTGNVGATIAVGTGQSTTDLLAATPIASFTGVIACIPVGTAATAIKLTADRTPSVTIGTSAVTAGKLNVIIDYVLSQ